MLNVRMLSVTMVTLVGLFGTSFAANIQPACDQLTANKFTSIDFKRTGFTLDGQEIPQIKADKVAGAKSLAQKMTASYGIVRKGSWEQYIHAYDRLIQKLTSRNDVLAYFYVMTENYPANAGNMLLKQSDFLLSIMSRDNNPLIDHDSLPYTNKYLSSQGNYKAPEYEKFMSFMLGGNDVEALNFLHELGNTPTVKDKFNQAIAYTCVTKQ